MGEPYEIDTEDEDGPHRRLTRREVLYERAKLARDMLELIERDMPVRAPKRVKQAVVQAWVGMSRLSAYANPEATLPVQALAQRNGRHHAAE